MTEEERKVWNYDVFGHAMAKYNKNRPYGGYKTKEEQELFKRLDEDIEEGLKDGTATVDDAEDLQKRVLAEDDMNSKELEEASKCHTNMTEESFKHWYEKDGHEKDFMKSEDGDDTFDDIPDAPEDRDDHDPEIQLVNPMPKEVDEQPHVMLNETE